MGAEEVGLLVLFVCRRVGSSQRELACFDVFHAHSLPVEQVAETLGSVALVDTLSLALLGEIKHVVDKLVDRVINALHTTVHNIDAVVGSVLNQLFHVATETRQVGRDARYTHHGALGGSVAPWLVVRREDAQMGTADEVVIVQRKDWVRRVQELGVENDLDTIRGVVEQLAATELVQDRVLGIVDHVVRHDRRQVVSLHREEPAAEQDLVRSGEQVFFVRHILTVRPSKRSFEQFLANVLLDRLNGIVQRLDHGLSLERFDGQRLRLSRQDNEGYHSHVRLGALHAVVQPRQRLDEHIHTLVAILITTSSEEVERILRIKVVVPVKVTSDEIVDLLLCLLMQVLELVCGGEFLNIQTIGQDAVGLALQKMFALVRGDVRDGGEDIGGVCGCALYAVAVVDATLSSFRIHIEKLQVVVEIDRTCAEVAAKKRSVCGEDGGDIDAALLAQGQRNTSKPLVELHNDGALLLVAYILFESAA